MNTYTVNLVLEDGWWLITIPEIPGAFSHTPHWDEIDTYVGEIVELMTGEKPGTYHVNRQQVAATG